MKPITEMTREELLFLEVKDIGRPLTAEEVIYMATTLGAFWSYDYEAAKAGRVGMHALLKSGLHSDGFFVSRIFLELWNIRYIMANQIMMRLRNMHVPQPDYVVGIPDGATKLGEEVTWMLGAKPAHMEKVEGRICLITPLEPGASLLLVEDVCTRGTGFIQAAESVLEQCSTTRIIACDPVIINRGGLQAVEVKGVGECSILPIVERRIQDWDPGKGECPLCALGSTAIKPKATGENWRTLLASQKEEKRVFGAPGSD
ncbi:MAG: hypothetical protein A2849_01780 [Candidatus Taylorbacteria bacterium RIFCSPHIGHO2_01_FULL_51_15]|uniref:Phosphoribosyltransferase domain-containing protein n=1 Tax=Candidatus Taylorbacteria bacterium RIFCSPHIGHO2_01_FULL_51_15 TaxID=1802304 RepID=A0A1G2MAX2_9BACT|nr:MAG: hypothetical protein A2849_01780 [Candidatus Taylorbacteria bacterium RIFCSPHIGHO2_01_FULL_51_15]